MNQKPTYEELERRLRDFEQAESERKRTAEAAQNTSELLSFFIKHSPIYAFLKIVSHQDSKVLYASENYIDMIGVPASQMLGKTMHELFPHEFAEKITRDDIDVIRYGKNLKLEEELNGRNYITYKFPLIQGGNKYLAGYTVDITDLKRTEEELVQIFTMSLDMICIADINTATFVKVNPAFTEILGYSEEAFLAKPFLDFVHPDDIDATRNIIEQKLRSGAKIINFENRHRCKDGSYRWLSWVSHPNIEQGITYAIARDITKWKENEKELKRGKALLDAVGRMARVGGWELDTATLEVIWTEETYRIHEVPFDYKPSLREAINFFHPEDIGRLEKAIKRSLDHGEPYDLELRFITAKGNYLWTRTMCQPEVVDGQIVQLKGTFQDITEQKNVEEALRRSAKDLRQSQQIAHLGSWRLDLATNQVEWTKELYNMYGFDPALPPPPYTEHMKLFTPESWQRLSTALAKTSETGIPYELELETVKEDGSNGWMWVRGETVSDAAGKTIGLWGAAQDISERKRIELALKESENKYRIIAENMADIITTTDMNLRFTYVSPSIQRLRGFTVEEALEQTIDQIMTPDSFQLLVNAFEEQLRLEATETADPDRTLILELEEYKKDGSTTWVENKASFIRDKDQKPIGILVVSRDISERRRAEAELKEVSSHQETLLSAIPDIVVEVDNRKVYTWANQPGCDFFGDDLIGKEASFYFVGEQDTYGAVKPIFNGEEEVVYLESWQRRKDGEKRLLAWWCKVLKGKTGKVLGALSTARDITEQKHAEEKLTRVVQEWQTTFDASNDAIWILDKDQRVMRSNKTAEGYFRCPVNQMVGRYCWEIVHGTDQPIPDCPILRTRKSLHREKMELKIGEGWFEIIVDPILNEAGQFNGVVHTARDITERKRAELALKESEDRFRALHNASFGGIAIHDKGLILECNKGLSEITGYAYDELIGMDGLYLISDDTREKVIRNIEAGYEKPYEATGVRKNGELYPIRLEARNIPYRRKNVRVVEFRDITENKRAEKEKEELEGKLRQAHKMEAVGRLAGGVAHDFNNMLSVIIGHADMAMEQVDAGLPLYADLEEIKKAGERSADLTRQLLAFARKQTVSPEILDLNKTVSGMTNMLQRLIGEDIDLKWLPGENVWPVKVDPGQIDQILANLCVNARDAIADVGKVTIETGNAEFDETYCNDHPGFVPGEYVLLSVSDNGCGMDTEALGKIFEPFFTTKESGKGTGLGLATVYGVVTQNKGFVNVYSEPGHGTTFKIYLPRHRTKAAFLPKMAKDHPPERGQETILLVEDEPAILRMTTMMIERMGYQVVAARTPGEAIRLAQEHAGKIHLLMTDVVMPEMNGRVLAKNILSIHPNLKRLFMSGYTANVIAHHGVLDKGVNFIQKPFSREELGAKVRKALDGDES